MMRSGLTTDLTSWWRRKRTNFPADLVIVPHVDGFGKPTFQTTDSCPWARMIATATFVANLSSEP